MTDCLLRLGLLLPFPHVLVLLLRLLLHLLGREVLGKRSHGQFIENATEGIIEALCGVKVIEHLAALVVEAEGDHPQGTHGYAQLEVGPIF